MPQTRKKPDTASIDLTYDELEVALVALALRQEELRDAKSPDNREELEHIWNVSDRMDIAQRKLEANMTRQMETWLESVTEKATKPKAQRKSPKQAPKRSRDGVLTRMSRLFRL